MATPAPGPAGHERLRHGRPAGPAPHRQGRGPSSRAGRRRRRPCPGHLREDGPRSSSSASSRPSSRRARPRDGRLDGYGDRRQDRHGPEVRPGRRGLQPSEYMASFVGFTPVERPRLAMIVVLDEPKEGLLRRPGLRPRVPATSPARSCATSASRRAAAAAGVLTAGLGTGGAP
ncbi:MAG: hypothetical protein MZU95_04810 [Desulfomicrobium escambiense]|nr:hypothetical protein [Desulfomicrobium escambiense]